MNVAKPGLNLLVFVITTLDWILLFPQTGSSMLNCFMNKVDYRIMAKNNEKMLGNK